MEQSHTEPVAPTDPTANTNDLLAARVRETPDRPLFSVPDGAGWRHVTAREFDHQVVALAKGFIASGLEPGERIAFIAQTSYEWTLVDFALWRAGLIMVPVYETSSESQLKWILEDSGSVGLITQKPEYTDMGTAVVGDLPAVRFTAAMHEGALDALVAAGRDVEDAEVEHRAGLATASDPATLIYTSGSTGRPKGCVLTHGNFVELARGTRVTLADLFGDGSSTLLFITLAHVFARFISVLCVAGGVRVGHQPNTAQLVDSLLTFRPTFLLAVPRVFEKVYNAAEQKADASGRGKIFRRAANIGVEYSKSLDTGKTPLKLKAQYWLYDKLVYSKLRDAMGGKVRHAVSGSAPLGEYLGHFYRAIGVNILEGYGLTETTAPVSVNLPRRSKIGTVGPALPGCSLKIAEDGEILTKGVNLFSEYWNNPEATREAFADDGWFHTGDLGKLDEDGYLTVTGRKKELIVTAGGKNVSPATLEDPIRAEPLVAQVVVVGDQKPFISALVTLDAEALPGWLELHGEPSDMSLRDAAQNPKVLAAIQAAVDKANTRVSRAESIRKFVVLDTEFSTDDDTLTPKLSVKRHVVLKKYSPVIDGIYNAAPPTRGISLQ